MSSASAIFRVSSSLTSFELSGLFTSRPIISLSKSSRMRSLCTAANASLPSVPARIWIDSAPAGCSSANSVKSYTSPLIATQQSSSLLCFSNSSMVTSRTSFAAFVSGTFTLVRLVRVFLIGSFLPTIVPKTVHSRSELPPKRLLP